MKHFSLRWKLLFLFAVVSVVLFVVLNTVGLNIMENKILTHKNIEDRIYYYLNSKIHNPKDNYVTIKNVTELSKILNLPRPSVSRSLSKMEEKGLIKRDKNRIEVL